MYNRAYGQRRPPVVPANYSGNAFYRVPPDEKPPETPCLPEPCCPPEEKLSEPPCLPEPCCPPKPPDCGCEADCRCERPSKKPGLPFFGGKLFPNGIGTDELLILALILMTAQGGDDDEILIFLILLLFCN